MGVMFILLFCIQSLLAFNATRLPRPQLNVTLFEPELPSPRYSVAEEWAETGSSGKINVPWTVTQNFPAHILPVLHEAMGMLEEDVGCVEFPEVSRESLENATWTNGIVFV